MDVLPFRAVIVVVMSVPNISSTRVIRAATHSKASLQKVVIPLEKGGHAFLTS